MPGSYGSVSRPVVLDPFRRIVEVHWRDDRVPLAFAFNIRVEAVSYSPGDPETLARAPRYFTPFSLYLPALIPKYWSAYALFEDDGWVTAASQNVDGLPDFGPPPRYEIGSYYEFDGGAMDAALRWAEPTGDALAFVTPVIGEGDIAPRAFLSGAAAIEAYDAALGSALMTLFTLPAVTATAGIHNFAYAGAVKLPRIVNGTSHPLIDDEELWVLCLPVTA